MGLIRIVETYVLRNQTVDVELLLVDLEGDIFSKKGERSARLGSWGRGIGGEWVDIHTFSCALSWEREGVVIG